MAGLHAAMVKSRANMNIVLEDRLIGMDDEETGGNPSVRRRMVRLAEWLEDIRVISAEPDFKKSFRLPIRKAAEFLSYLRRGDVPTSIDIDGLVFAVSSPYYDETADTEVSTVSAVFPCLQSAMHVRVKDAEVASGWNTFSKVQPIPLINRINPIRMKIGKLGKRPDIGEMDFLKCPLSGVAGFERSLAMENFCEIENGRDDRPKLGAPLVVCGRVKDISPYRIVVCGCDAARSSMTASLSPELGSGFENAGLGGMKGAWVRMLVAVWYHGDGDGEKDRMRPVAYMIEKTTRDQAIVDEMVGHARMFGPVALADMEREYGRIPERLPMAVVGGKVSSPGCPVIPESEAYAKFIAVTADIRAARFSTGLHDLHCQPDDILDDKLTRKYLQAKLRKHKDMRLMLTRIIRCGDYHKQPTKKELRHLMDIGSRFSYYLWLLEHKFVQRDEDDRLVATKAGIEGALESTRGDIERAIKPGAAVFLPGADVDVPGPLAIKYFEKHDSYSPINMDGYPCDVAWVRQDASDEDVNACRSKVDRMMYGVLDAFYSSYHSITAEYVADAVADNGSKIPAAYIGAVLSTLERAGRVSRDGDSWRVPMRGKMERVIARSDKALSKEGIMRSSFVAGMYKDAAEDELAALEKDGIARKLPDGRWISVEKLDQWEGQVAYEEATKAALALLGKRRSGMDKDMFMDRLGSSVQSAIRGSNWREQLRRAVGRLEDDRVIEANDGMYRLGAGR